MEHLRLYYIAHYTDIGSVCRHDVDQSPVAA
jgi:hypothetical protein